MTILPGAPRAARAFPLQMHVEAWRHGGPAAPPADADRPRAEPSSSARRLAMLAPVLLYHVAAMAVAQCLTVVLRGVDHASRLRGRRARPDAAFRADQSAELQHVPAPRTPSVPGGAGAAARRPVAADRRRRGPSCAAGQAARWWCRYPIRSSPAPSCCARNTSFETSRRKDIRHDRDHLCART